MLKKKSRTVLLAHIIAYHYKLKLTQGIKGCKTFVNSFVNLEAVKRIVVIVTKPKRAATK